MDYNIRKEKIPEVESKINILASLILLMPIFWLPIVIFSSVYVSYFNLPISISTYDSFIFLYGIIFRSDISILLMSLGLLFFLLQVYIWTNKGFSWLKLKICDFLRKSSFSNKPWVQKICNFVLEKLVISLSLVTTILLLFLVLDSSKIEEFMKGNTLVLFLVVVTMLPFGLMIMFSELAVPCKTEELRDKCLTVAIVVGISCWIVSSVSLMAIKDLIYLEQRGGDVLRVWIDERNEYLLSCNKAESYGKVMVKQSILGSGINKKEVFQDEVAVELSNIDSDRVRAICNRHARKD